MKGNSRLERRVQRAGQGQKPEAASLAPHRRLNGSLKRLAEVTRAVGRDGISPLKETGIGELIEKSTPVLCLMRLPFLGSKFGWHREQNPRPLTGVYFFKTDN